MERLDDKLAERLAELTEIYGRAPAVEKKDKEK